MIVPGAAASRSFPPEVAMHVVKIACERPDVATEFVPWLRKYLDDLG